MSDLDVRAPSEMPAAPVSRSWTWRIVGLVVVLGLLVGGVLVWWLGSDDDAGVEPFAYGDDLTEWVSVEEVHALLERIADEYGGELAPVYEAASEPVTATQEVVSYQSVGYSGSDADDHLLRLEVRVGVASPPRVRLDPDSERWRESDRLPEGAEYHELWYGFAVRSPESDDYVEVLLWDESGSDLPWHEYRDAHLDAGSMLLHEMGWAEARSDAPAVEPATTVTAPPTAGPEPVPPTTEAEPTTSATAPPTTEVVEPADEFERLSGLPWAAPSDDHQDPSDAVRGFLAFVRGRAALGGDQVDGDFGAVTIGEFRPGDQRSGEVEVTFVDGVFDMQSSRGIRPVATVFVRQAGPDDAWWVLGAVTDILVIVAPAADAVVLPSFELGFVNRVVSDPFRIEVHGQAIGGEPLYRAVGNGGGVFAEGSFAIEVDTTSCEDPTLSVVVASCDGPGPSGGGGTVIVFHNHGVTTLPVEFA